MQQSSASMVAMMLGSAPANPSPAGIMVPYKNLSKNYFGTGSNGSEMLHD